MSSSGNFTVVAEMGDSSTVAMIHGPEKKMSTLKFLQCQLYPKDYDAERPS